jgi:hypothetical protein
LQIQFEGSDEKSNLNYIATEKQTIGLSLSKKRHSGCRFLTDDAGTGLRPGSFVPYAIGFAEDNGGTFASRAYRQAL